MGHNDKDIPKVNMKPVRVLGGKAGVVEKTGPNSYRIYIPAKEP